MSANGYTEVIIADPPIRCAFVQCQAGGDAQPNAPVVDGRSVRRTGLWYHPGCWAAERRLERGARA